MLFIMLLLLSDTCPLFDPLDSTELWRNELNVSLPQKESHWRKLTRICFPKRNQGKELPEKGERILRKTRRLEQSKLKSTG
jgi:hypothetical protein